MSLELSLSFYVRIENLSIWWQFLTHNQSNCAVVLVLSSSSSLNLAFPSLSLGINILILSDKLLWISYKDTFRLNTHRTTVPLLCSSPLQVGSQQELTDSLWQWFPWGLGALSLTLEGIRRPIWWQKHVDLIESR